METQLKHWKTKTDLLNLIQKLQIPNLNGSECATLLFYNWGDKYVVPSLIFIPDDDLVELIKAKYQVKWNLMQKTDLSEIGATETKVITDTETIKDVSSDDSSRVKAESALNVNSYIETDKTDFNKTVNSNKTLTKYRKELLIDNTLKNRDILEHSFDLCYNVSKDIAKCLTLDFY